MVIACCSNFNFFYLWDHERHTWKTLKNFQIFFRKIFKVLKWSAMDFALWKSTQKWFFVDFTFFTYEVWGSKHTKISKIFYENFSKFFNVLKLSEMSFALWKSTQKWFFVDFAFFHLCSTGVEKQKFRKIFRKFFKSFQSPKMVWKGFCAMKEHSKVIFVDFVLFNQVGLEQLSFWNSLK